jgi:hypothetical protein
VKSKNLGVLARRIRHEHNAVIAASKRTISHALTAHDLSIEAKEKVPHGVPGYHGRGAEP